MDAMHYSLRDALNEIHQAFRGVSHAAEGYSQSWYASHVLKVPLPRPRPRTQATTMWTLWKQGLLLQDLCGHRFSRA